MVGTQLLELSVLPPRVLISGELGLVKDPVTPRWVAGPDTCPSVISWGWGGGITVGSTAGSLSGGQGGPAGFWAALGLLLGWTLKLPAPWAGECAARYQLDRISE